jgi:membrane protein
MNIKKRVALSLLIIQLGSFSLTTTNALQDAKNAEKNDAKYNQIKKQNQSANDDPVLFNVGQIMNAAGKGASLYNLNSAVSKISSSTLSGENDTNTNPMTWTQVKLKWWEVVLVAIFIARELREVARNDGGGNSVVTDAKTEKTPIGEIKNTNDIRTKIVMNLFKVTGNITDKVGRSISNIMAIFMLLMGTLEILIGILKGVTAPDTDEQKTILMIIKDMFPQITVMSIMVGLLANGFFWNFYTGPLFNLSMKLGGLLAGKSFNMRDLPDYITKLFNVPFKVMLTAVKMLFSVKGVMNNINPMLILLAGLIILWMSMKAAIEIMTVLVDYLLIGCFSMVTMVFVVLGITKNIGFGALGGIISAMVNVIVTFALIGYAFQLIDRLDGEGSSDISKLLGIIAGVFIVYGLLKQIKTIGNALNSGSAASIKASSITTEVVRTGFNIAIAGKAVQGGFDKLTERTDGGNISLGTAFKEVVNAGKENMMGKEKNLQEMRDTTLEVMEGNSTKAEGKLENYIKKKKEESKGEKTQKMMKKHWEQTKDIMKKHNEDEKKEKKS